MALIEAPEITLRRTTENRKLQSANFGAPATANHPTTTNGIYSSDCIYDFLNI